MRRVDKRADIWAFGCVLFELLTGQPPFARDTVTDTLVSVVEHEPDWSLLPPAVTPRVRELLRRCLAKDVRNRLRDIGDARCDEAQSAATSTVATARGRRRWRVAWFAGGALVLASAILLGALSWRSPRDAPRPTNITMGRLTDFVGIEDSPALSPDGKSVAFVGRVSGVRQVSVRLLSGGSPLQLTHGATDSTEPRWTPDSSAVIFFTLSSAAAESGTLAEISALGGSARRLTEARAGADLSRDGHSLATIRFVNERLELAVLSADGSRTLRAQPLDGAIGGYGNVRWSPDGHWLAFRRRDEAFNDQMLVVSAEGGDPTVVARSSELFGFLVAHRQLRARLQLGGR